MVGCVMNHQAVVEFLLWMERGDCDYSVLIVIIVRVALTGDHL